jgi:hypothetical protein
VTRDIREIERFLDGGVTAADDGDVLAFVEKAVARRAARNAFAHELLLGIEPQIHRRSAGRNDQRIASVGGLVADHGDRLFGQLGGMDMVEHDFGPEALGMLLEALHQLRPLHAVGVSRPVVDVGGGHELTPLGEPGDEDGLEVCTGGVNRGAVSSGAGTEDQYTAMLRCLGHGRFR